MSTIRSAVYSFAAFIACAWLLPGTGAAQETYFARDCIGCHVNTERTCNGCHMHGTHLDVKVVSKMNLTASTDKTTYVEGDPIVVTLDGSNMADFKGWVGARIYDVSGTEVTRKQDQLGCAPDPTVVGNKCDLPMKLNVPATLGWTKLYASWAGNQADRPGAAFGALLGNTFGAGRRPLKDGSGNQVANHIEEIVATGTFAVTPAPPKPIPEPTPTPTPPPAQGSGGGSSNTDAGSSGGTQSTSTTQASAGAGAFDLWFALLLLAGLASTPRCVRCTKYPGSQVVANQSRRL